MRQIADGRFELDDHEIALAMKIGDRLKREFAAVVQTAMDAADKSGVPTHCVMSAVATETLLIAACCHNGTPESFRGMVDLAMTAAEKFKAAPDEAGAMQ
jgi:hypothetical protein